MNPIDRAGSAARSVGGYISNVARSVRDVPTALGTALDSKGAMATGSNGNNDPKAPIKNLVTQIGQVGKSALGQKDYNRSDQYDGPNKIYQNNVVSPIKPSKGK